MFCPLDPQVALSPATSLIWRSRQMRSHSRNPSPLPWEILLFDRKRTEYINSNKFSVTAGPLPSWRWVPLPNWNLFHAPRAILAFQGLPFTILDPDVGSLEAGKFSVASFLEEFEPAESQSYLSGLRCFQVRECLFRNHREAGFHAAPCYTFSIVGFPL